VSVLSAALLMLLVMDPFGNIPFYVAELQHVDPARRSRVVVRELLFALAVLLVFLFAGQFILNALQISEPALTAAGGCLLFLISVKMVFPGRRDWAAEEGTGEPFIVPLAVPYVAGPSAMAALLLIMNREPERWPAWLLAVFLAWLVTAVIISLAAPLARLLGRKGLIAIERLMGMLLVGIAVQMLMTGIAQFLATVRG
jgi:multiple antibiotic resistance protein